MGTCKAVLKSAGQLHCRNWLHMWSLLATVASVSLNCLLGCSGNVFTIFYGLMGCHMLLSSVRITDIFSALLASWCASQ